MALVLDCRLTASAWLQQAALGQGKAADLTHYLGHAREVHLYTIMGTRYQMWSSYAPSKVSSGASKPLVHANTVNHG